MRIQSGVYIEENEKSQAIRNRESWLKVLVIALFSFIIALKLVTSSFNINMSDFRFTDLLSLILAIFAMVLSVAFYFKATDTSNDFYNNTFIFTKEISEILGRIEAGFGERLRHLDEGYTKLGDKFENLPFDPIKAEKKVKHEEEEIKKKEIERDRMLEELAQRAKLEDNEKKALFNKLDMENKELLDAKRELEFLKRRLEDAERSSEHPPSRIPRMRASTKVFLANIVNQMEVFNATPGEIDARFNSLKEDIPEGIIDDLKHIGFLSPDGELTVRGVQILRNIAKNT